MRTVTQPGGEKTHYEYDALGHILEETLPDGSQSRNVWDTRGLKSAHIDAIGAVTRYSYDELGRMVSLEDQEGHVSHNRYDQQNNIAGYIDPAGEPFTAWFDERGLVRREEDSRGRKKSFGYDAAGRLQTLIDARGTRIDYTYTPASLIERINYTNGSKSHTQSFTYDEAGALKTASDNGVVTRYNHQNGIYIPNPFDLTTTIDESLKGRTLSSSYSYDIMQRLNSVGYSNNDKIVYQYNTLGELEGITGYMDNTGFDANGRLTGYELANGVRSHYEYDVKGRVTSMDYHDADGQAAKSYRFAYDLVDNIIQRNEEYYSYDRKGQMLSAVIGGLMGTEEYPLNQDEFQFGSVRSDVRSELPMEIPSEELTLDWGAGSLGIDLGYAYMIKKIVLKLKGGAGSIRKEQIALSTSMYNREELFREQEFDMKEAQDGTLTFILRGRSYSRYIKIHSHINPLDADGEPIRPAEVFELDTGSVQVYALSGGKNVFYRYAPDGDRQSRAEMTDQIRSDEYTYYPMSDLVRIVGTYAYRYDENGNLIEKGDVYVESGEDVSIEQSGDYTLFEYDLLNRMVSVSKIAADTGALKPVVSYRYNHKNLRIERTDDEGTTRYVFDLDGNIIEEHDAERLTRYVFRNNKHLAKITPDGKTYYYGTDNLGSTTALFDEDGNVVWKGEISAFGDVVLGEWIGEELFDERVRFTGKDYDEVTGLYYFNARWYDPQLGRFTSEDPIRDGMNWHVYVNNNPLRYIDPTGLMGDAAALAAAEAKRNIPNSDSKEKWTRPNDDKDDKGHKIDKSTSNHGVDQWVNRNMVLQNAWNENYELNVKQPMALARYLNLIGMKYGHSYPGQLGGVGTVEFFPDGGSGAKVLSEIDCTELLSYVFGTPLYRTWEFGNSPDFIQVDTPTRGDVIIDLSMGPAGGVGHGSIVSGDRGGDILHSDSLGPRDSNDYIQSYFQRKGNTGIQRSYFRAWSNYDREHRILRDAQGNIIGL